MRHSPPRRPALLPPTECNGCGVCCDPVVIPFDRMDTAQLALCDPRDRDWMLNDLTVMPYKEAVVKGAYMTDQMARLSGTPGGPPLVRFGGFYRCRWFDDETRSCTNYDNRPPVCSGYPWQGNPPDRRAALPPECSFNADLGQPVKVTIRRSASDPPV